MTISRRALGAAAGAVALGFVTGCSTTPQQRSRDRLKWLAGLDGVEKAGEVPNGDDPNDTLILLTLAKGIRDRSVLALVGTVKRDFDSHGRDYYDSIELDIDGFHARFFPHTVDHPDRDVARALWLRRDGRATSAVYGSSSGLVVTAPQAAVAAVALGFDSAGAHEDGRRTHRVESADRAMVVEWTDSPGLDFQLDRSVAKYLADLQKHHPHLAGWFDGAEGKAGIYFSPADIGFDALLATLPKIVDAKRFKELDLGWGPARASHDLFPTAFTGRIRTVLDHLVKIRGVTGLRVETKLGKATIESVTVRDRASYLAGLAALRKLWDSYLSIELIRKPSRFVGQDGNWVFDGSIFDGEREQAIHATVADLSGVTRVQVGHDVANLIVAPDISDAQLATTLSAFAALPASYRIDLYAAHDVLRDLVTVGQITKRRFVAATAGPRRADPHLIARIRAGWQKAVG